MATPNKKDYGVTFVNIDLKFGAEMYFNKEDPIPNEADLFVWIADVAKEFYRVGFGYNENSHSYTASVTYRGGKSTDVPPCLTQHGKSPLSALLKCYVVLELVGGRTEGFKFASDVLAELELKIEEAIKRMM